MFQAEKNISEDQISKCFTILYCEMLFCPVQANFNCYHTPLFIKQSFCFILTMEVLYLN